MPICALLVVLINSKFSGSGDDSSVTNEDLDDLRAKVKLTAFDYLTIGLEYESLKDEWTYTKKNNRVETYNNNFAFATVGFVSQNFYFMQAGTTTLFAYLSGDIGGGCYFFKDSGTYVSSYKETNPAYLFNFKASMAYNYKSHEIFLDAGYRYLGSTQGFSLNGIFAGIGYSFSW